MGKGRWMKTTMLLAVASFGTLALQACSGSSGVEERKESREQTTPHRARAEAVGLKVVVTVMAVDVENRRITLKGPEGRTGDYEVSDVVKRLSEIKVGDKLEGEYQVLAVAELREARPEEKAAPLVVIKQTQRALPGFAPKGTILRTVRAVTTITALDAAARTVTVMNPLGGQITAPVESGATFDALKVGQTIIVVFGESLSIAVVK